MSVPVEDLQSLRDDLARQRGRGVRRVEMSDGMSIEYKTDAEMSAAIADLDRQIAAAGSARPRALKFSHSKGV